MVVWIPNEDPFQQKFSSSFFREKQLFPTRPGAESVFWCRMFFSFQESSETKTRGFDSVLYIGH